MQFNLKQVIIKYLFNYNSTLQYNIVIPYNPTNNYGNRVNKSHNPNKLIICNWRIRRKGIVQY
jgi:hypothetical protein